MTTATREPARGSGAAVCLSVVHPDGRQSVRELAAGDSLVAGAEKSCGLQLPGEGVSGLHCQLKFTDGELWVHDWYSATGTFVDGQQISAPTRVPPGGEIRIGQFRIRADFRGGSAPAAAPVPVEPVERNALAEPDSVVGPAHETPAAEKEEHEAAMHVARLETELQVAQAEIDRLRGELLRVPAAPVAERNGSGYRTDSLDDDTVDLLRAEVENLQHELAERDARLVELTALAEGAQDQDGSAAAADDDSPETLALVERLEELLAELQRSDERVSAAEQLLQLSEEAQLAEQEERRQMEVWVGEIERRIGEREAEWQAENETLLLRLDEMTGQRDRAERRLEQAGSGDEAAALHGSIVEELRRENAGLEERLRAAETRSAELESRLQAQVAAGDEEPHEMQDDEALRGERLELAQERATLARQRAELERLREDLEKEQQKLGPSGGADDKIHAFRAHLREIHEQEARQRQQKGLAGRISRLWKRVDG